MTEQDDDGGQNLPERVLISAKDDRWAWRRRLRSKPRTQFLYRVGVAVLGLLLIILAGLTGPFPGPGGIPLLLVGLAVWASEFEWAQHVMLWVKKKVREATKLPLPWRIVIIVAIVLGILAGLYTSMAVTGVPTWLPDPLQDWLASLPGM
ncbi:PGPGW domain-containing protein [Microlunatus sp. Y2014]|uniref:PGPGW domain-containing protein n=1 Tax=Microlunatus sp. Y2014 TaxID=3418488 RepID=UPI003DA6D862